MEFELTRNGNDQSENLRMLYNVTWHLHALTAEKHICVRGIKFDYYS